MRVSLFILSLLLTIRSFADVSVSATVDQAHVAFGEAVTLTLSVNGSHSNPQVSIPKIDGLNFAGPSVNSQFSLVNGAMSQSVSLTYQVTPTRTGEFAIPVLDVNIAGKVYKTEPIKLIVDKPGTQAGMQDTLFAKVRLNSQQLYLGQTAPLDVILFARGNLPVRGLSGFSAEADGLGYKYNSNIKSGPQTINSVAYNLYVIEGAISPTHAGTLNFGPCVIKAQLTSQKRGQNPFNNPFFDDFFGRTEVREMPITLDAVPIDVQPLPAECQPKDFAGAIGQWNLEYTAKPNEVAVGDPITVTIKITGSGNIATVPALALTGLDNFKAYDPSSKTTSGELNTTGERVFQQVLIAKNTTVKAIPAVRLSYFDPVSKAYKTITQGPLQVTIKPGTAGHSAIVTGTQRARPSEKLGQDIVYLKGELGAALSPVFFGTPGFWALSLLPVLGLAGALSWKRRQDRLTGDVAYARRSRAARNARKQLAGATTTESVQRALQEYLGNRLNIPASGITGAIVEERGLPATVSEIFDACDAARFAGQASDTLALKLKVEQVIDELENLHR